MKLLLLIVVFIISGCVSNPSIKTVDTIVKVPVSVPCKIKNISKPDMPVDGLKKEDELDVKTAAALAELERRKAYEKELEAAIKECQ